MHRLSASLLFLFAGTFTFAQAPNHSEPTVATVQVEPLPRPESAGCPISFLARRQASTAQVQIGNGAPPIGPSQGLHLKLNHQSRPAIESIEVTVYATSLKGRAVPASQQAKDILSKTFELHRVTGNESLSEADVWMQHVGSLRWADLISITYVNGTTWHPTENRTCRAVPSLFLLVGNK